MSKIKEILIGTHNKGKYREICNLLPNELKKYSPKEFNLYTPEETGKSFEENSLIKASIVAKVSRDLFMIKLAKKYPKYCWNKNFGYGTADHLLGLKKYGITKHHRKKFKPIHKILMNKTRETQ